MTSDKQSRLNADQLESALAQERDGLSELEQEARARREQALEQMGAYVSMLRNTTATRRAADGLPRRPFSFKLEFEDGRWNVDEIELDVAPRVGDIVSFDDGRPWRIRATQVVRARPARKPVREFFVCAPAA
ncbi:MAG TPA: hypothetical protein VGN27_00110 [Gaiellaceae bacterium]|jgi:hypothetical protein|nr:hypothetical protein [Gaiellaceae bacterium]